MDFKWNSPFAVDLPCEASCPRVSSLLRSLSNGYGAQPDINYNNKIPMMIMMDQMDDVSGYFDPD